MIKQWRILCLAGVGLAISGACVAFAAVVFTDLGLVTTIYRNNQRVDVSAWTVSEGVFFATEGICVGAIGLWGYRTRTLLARMLLGALLIAMAVGLIVFGSQVIPAAEKLAHEPFRGIRVALLFWAAGIVVVGGVLVAAATPWKRSIIAPVSRAGVVVLAAGLMLGTATGVGAAVLLPRDGRHVDATTAGPTNPAPPPGSPTAEKWRWHSKETIFSVRPAGAGVVVATESGLTALDGVTGKERWHFRRDDTKTLSGYGPVVLDGGRIVAELFVGANTARWHAFNAFTGELIWREEGGRLPADLGRFETRTMLISPAHSDRSLYSAVDGRAGKVAWQWSIPGDCFTESQTETTADLVLASLNCRPNQPAVVALDAASGREVWRYQQASTTTGDRQPIFIPRVAATQSGVILVHSGNPLEHGTVSLDPRTGQEIGKSAGDLFIDSADPLNSTIIDKSVGLFQIPEPAPRWPLSHDTVSILDGNQIAWLATTIAVLDYGGCAGSSQSVLLLDRATGARVRSLACVETGLHSQLVTAPGAVVLVQRSDEGPQSTDLVGYA